MFSAFWSRINDIIRSAVCKLVIIMLLPGIRPWLWSLIDLYRIFFSIWNLKLLPLQFIVMALVNIVSNFIVLTRRRGAVGMAKIGSMDYDMLPSKIVIYWCYAYAHVRVFYTTKNARKPVCHVLKHIGNKQEKRDVSRSSNLCKFYSLRPNSIHKEPDLLLSCRSGNRSLGDPQKLLTP